MPGAALEFDQVSKQFPGVKALDGVSFEARAGQVHGLLGENGAGKSTLLKILGGQYRADGGRLLLEGKECRFHSAADAIAAGIAVIHQELQYVPELTVAENVLLVPTHALLRFGSGIFLPVQVSTGITTLDYTELVAGVPACQMHLRTTKSPA